MKFGTQVGNIFLHSWFKLQSCAKSIDIYEKPTESREKITTEFFAGNKIPL